MTTGSASSIGRLKFLNFGLTRFRNPLLHASDICRCPCGFVFRGFLLCNHLSTHEHALFLAKSVALGPVHCKDHEGTHAGSGSGRAGDRQTGTE